MAGYPLRADDLTTEEWEDLGQVEEFTQQRNREKEQTNLINLLKRK
ncbi:MAG: hypothetical protein M0Q01_01670 [Syntrophales bacterium]|jgi:hypothetical protein|nr:hypothetical protein [Syntrophales bacterium]